MALGIYTPSGSPKMPDVQQNSRKIYIFILGGQRR